MKVYLLYDYGEYGPENLIATLDVSCLPAMAERIWPEPDNLDACADISPHWVQPMEEEKKYHGTHLRTPRMVVERWIKEGRKSDELSLAIGWGAPVLRVLELENGPEPDKAAVESAAASG